MAVRYIESSSRAVEQSRVVPGAGCLHHAAAHTNNQFFIPLRRLRVVRIVRLAECV